MKLGPKIEVHSYKLRNRIRHFICWLRSGHIWEKHEFLASGLRPFYACIVCHKEMRISLRSEGLHERNNS